MSEKAIKRGKAPKNDIKFNLSLGVEQKLAKADIITKPYSFILGAAGSGKTLLACQIALDRIFKREMTQMIITRPTVGTEDNGFLPGTLNEKMEPWLVPIKSNLTKLYGTHQSKLDKMYEENQIEMIALSHFRGRTFDNCVCIIDEFQNLTKSQLQMCLGRLGVGSMMMFCGDPDQIDLPNKNNSAVNDVSRLKDLDIVGIHKLIDNHRHPAVIKVLRALKNY